MADNAHATPAGGGGGDAHAEIIIVKHGGEEHDDHHGGAWKIAFADFMTAMMALFLVLWLTSTNNKTKSIIARYFNPVQLVDSTPQPPGLSDPSPTIPPRPKSPPPAADTKNAGASPSESHTAGAAAGESKPDSNANPESKASDAQAKHDDAELFKDPYAVLAELAAKNNTPQPKTLEKSPTEGVQGGSGAVGVRSGDAYRDPFEPLAMPTYNQPEPQADPSPPKPDVNQQADVAALRSKIEAAMKANDKAAGAGGDPKLDIRRTDEGILIALTDDANFSMFARSSAEPAPKTVTLMDKIGRVLKTQKGKITIRGFTDNRQYRSETYDNWRLSSARADIAHYMLMRGGIEEARFERIEGYADRRPKNVKDPASAENRRIEILLRETAP